MELLLIIPLIVAFYFIYLFRNKNSPKNHVSKTIDDEYTPITLINKSELSVMKILEDQASRSLTKGLRISAQVSYGAFLNGNNNSSHAKVKQKRADFVAFDTDGKVVCVFEYQGTGHYGRSQASRLRVEKSDKVKRMALLSAQIPLIEIPAKYTRNEVNEMCSKYF